MEFADGVRVRVKPHFWWPKGAVGTVRPFPGVLQNVPHVQRGGGMAVDPGGCTRPYQDTHGPRTRVWVVFDEPAQDCDGDGPYSQGEVLSQHLEPAPPDARYFPANSFPLPDGSLAVKCVCFGISCAEVWQPDASDFEFWRWLSAHADLFPEVNDHNMASARAAFARQLAEQRHAAPEASRGVSRG